MNNKPLYPVSGALSKLISTETLRSDMGIKAITDIGMIKNYLIETNRLEELDKILINQQRFFVVNDDEVVNDHLLIAIKSPEFENEHNLVVFLLPSILTYEKETEENIQEVMQLFALPSERDSFYEAFQICQIKCRIVKATKEKIATKENLN
jgi:hypothetical protein